MQKTKYNGNTARWRTNILTDAVAAANKKCQSSGNPSFSVLLSNPSN